MPIAAQDFSRQMLLSLDLPPARNPGMHEIMTHMAQHHILPQVENMPGDDARAGLECTFGYLKFQTGLVRDYTGGFYAGPASVPEEIFCAVLGGADILPARWDTWQAERAKTIVYEAGHIRASASMQFTRASVDVRFYYMINLMDRLSVAQAMIEQSPDSVSAQDISDLRDTSRRAQTIPFEHTPLAAALRRCARKVDQTLNCRPA